MDTAADEMIDETKHPRWNAMWEKGIPPGASFDMECPSPALVQLETDGLLPQGRALVPGCGRGYDVTFLSSPTRFVVGLDIASSAVESAQARAEALAVESAAAGGGGALSLSQLQFACTSFFDLPTELESDKFDLIYDYTFLCAMEPSIRVQWAEQMAALLLPGGVLVTLIFPICDKPTGPPYAMSLELVRELLEGVGLEAVLGGEPALLSSELSHPGRDGSGIWEASSGLGRWRKKQQQGEGA